MNNNFNSGSKTNSSLIPTLFLGFVLTFGLFGCSSGGDDEPAVVLPELSINNRVKGQVLFVAL